MYMYIITYMYIIVSMKKKDDLDGTCTLGLDRKDCKKAHHTAQYHTRGAIESLIAMGSQKTLCVDKQVFHHCDASKQCAQSKYLSKH